MGLIQRAKLASEQMKKKIEETNPELKNENLDRQVQLSLQYMLAS